MKLFFTLAALTLNYVLSGQYFESFSISDRGILSGPCMTSDPTSCSSYDFTGVNWTIGGDLSGIDSEGFKTGLNYLLAEDTDGNACWFSPNIDISLPSSSSITVTVSIPSGSIWDASTSPTSLDYLDVEYSIDGGAFVRIENVNGCLTSGHTISSSGCGTLVGPMTFNPTISGLVGNTLDIRICTQMSASSDDAQIESVSVPESGTQLPVELMSFTTMVKGNIIQLEWTTASEIDNDYFEVERSIDGVSFEVIGRVDGSDNSTLIKEYQFFDKNPPESKSVYYRLRQVDYDGAYEFSPIEVVQFEVGNHNISIQPNPMSDQALIHLGKSIEESLLLKIYNINGQLIRQISIPKNILIYPLKQVIYNKVITY